MAQSPFSASPIKPEVGLWHHLLVRREFSSERRIDLEGLLLLKDMGMKVTIKLDEAVPSGFVDEVTWVSQQEVIILVFDFSRSELIFTTTVSTVSGRLNELTMLANYEDFLRRVTSFFLAPGVGEINFAHLV